MGLPKPYYEKDGITIYHADNRDILPYLPKVGLVLTDPPYGVEFRDSEWDSGIPDWLPECRTIADTVIFMLRSLYGVV